MKYKGRRSCLVKGLTLVELLIAMAIIVVLFAALVPQFRVIQNSWDSKAAACETVQSGRVLIDHLYRNLSKAVRVTAVSDANTTSGYIEFEDNEGATLRYDVAVNNYVEFGEVGSLSELAGPVSQLQFTCYDACDLDVAITDVNMIRAVKVETALVDASGNVQDKNFLTWAYLCANYQDDDPVGGTYNVSKVSESWTEFDSTIGMEPALCQIDATHYLCAYRGESDDGWAVVLTVDTGTWDVNTATAFEYDSTKGLTPALAKIDATHYLCAYQGEDDDGWAVVLTIDTGDWSISGETPFEFDTTKGVGPALSEVDSTHYLCAYQGEDDDGWALVLTVNTGDFSISGETPFEFDEAKGVGPALSQVDSTHYLCAYQGDKDDGWAVVLTIDTGDWSISGETPFEFDEAKGVGPALSQVDSTHYLCAYAGNADLGMTVVLTVNTGDWTITSETPFEFDTVGMTPALSKIDDTHHLCAYTGPYSDGWSVVLTVDSGNWSISNETPFEFDTATGIAPALCEVDSEHYLCAYEGDASVGWAGVLKFGPPILP